MTLNNLIFKIAYLKFKIIEANPGRQLILINEAIPALEKSGYKISDNSDIQLIFNSGNTGKFMLPGTYAQKLHLGILTLETIKNEPVVSLQYYVTILSKIFLFILFAIISVLFSYWVFLYIGVIVFRLIIKINRLKRVAKHLISEIIKNSTHTIS